MAVWLNPLPGSVTPDFTLIFGSLSDWLASPSPALTGATAPIRFVGGTTSGAPTSSPQGGFQVGDFVVDQTGIVWVCTTAGSPGTWNQVGLPNTAWTSYTPTWSSSGTQPSIGNGSLIGRYVRQGKMCSVRIALKGGSTTTVGTGGYSFALPFSAAITAGEQVLAAELYDGASHYISYGLVGDGGGSSVAPFSLKGGTGGTALQMSGGTAFAAGLAAFITIQGTYETA